MIIHGVSQLNSWWTSKGNHEYKSPERGNPYVGLAGPEKMLTSWILTPRSSKIKHLGAQKHWNITRIKRICTKHFVWQAGAAPTKFNLALSSSIHVATLGAYKEPWYRFYQYWKPRLVVRTCCKRDFGRKHSPLQALSIWYIQPKKVNGTGFLQSRAPLIAKLVYDFNNYSLHHL